MGTVGILESYSRGAGTQNVKPIAARSEFAPLAAYAPAATTSPDGRVSLSFTLPDTLTRYRVIAVAVKGATHFGTAESTISARLPLTVRPSLPRFLNLGDMAELPVVVQNQTDREMTVKVAARVSNLKMDTRTNHGVSVKVPPNDRVEVRFPATTYATGEARFQVAVTSGNASDATTVSLPVLPPEYESHVVYGTLDRRKKRVSVSYPFKPPVDVWPGVGHITVSASSTAMHELTDAFLYLGESESESTQRLSSRMLSVIALRDLLSAFESEFAPSEAELDASIERDIAELASRQKDDGGFGAKRRRHGFHPMVSVQTAHAFALASERGHHVPEHVKRRSLKFLETMSRRLPHYYPDWSRRYLTAYALHVRNVFGENDVAAARTLIADAGGVGELPLASLGWLLGVLSGDSEAKVEVADLRKRIQLAIHETSESARVESTVERRDFGPVMLSPPIADATMLEALIDDQPKSVLIPKLARSLLADRKYGRWSNAQENLLLLLALGKYFGTYESQEPNFVARVRLGDTFAGAYKFKGRTTQTGEFEIPMSDIGESKSANLVLQKRGRGRMYYRIRMSYLPKSFLVAPQSNGFTVERQYESVDNHSDVVRRTDGTWIIRAGARVKVSVKLVAPVVRHHVKLVDPLPAGLEPLNPELAHSDAPSGAARTFGSRGFWLGGTRFEGENVRGERAEAFGKKLRAGAHKYSYYARATTPGKFVAPPAKVEEMYDPEVFGRSASDRVDVVD